MLAICRYHRNSNGWNDIGYQALVDKYGVLYEGRAGGLDKPVLGAHAQGFNAAEHRHREHRRQHLAVGLSGRGARLAGRLPALEAHAARRAADRARPRSRARAGPSSRYPAGRRVRVPRVLGHRDTNSTACPGSALYAQLDDLRARVATGEPLPGVPTFLTSAALSASPHDLRGERRW